MGKAWRIFFNLGSDGLGNATPFFFLDEPAAFLSLVSVGCSLSDSRSRLDCREAIVEGLKIFGKAKDKVKSLRIFRERNELILSNGEKRKWKRKTKRLKTLVALYEGKRVKLK